MHLLFIVFAFQLAAPISPESLKKTNLTGFSQAAEIIRVIKLETTPESLVGFIDHVEVDAETQAVFVGDFNSTKSILKFDSQGIYQGSLSRQGQGPGEFRGRILSFSVIGKQIFVLTDTHLSRFSLAGVFQEEINLIKTVLPLHMTAMGGQLYMNTLVNRAKGLGALLVYNQDLKLISTFGDFEPRKTTYLFTQASTLAVNNNRLWVSEAYEPLLNVFDGTGKLHGSFRLPQRNKQTLDALWATKTFNEDTRSGIKKNMHRFNNLIPYKKGVLAFEFSKSPDWVYRMYYFEIGKGVDVYDGYHFLNRSYADRELVFSWIAGRSADQLIGVYEYGDSYSLHSKRYPLLEGSHLMADDNPILILFSPTL